LLESEWIQAYDLEEPVLSERTSEEKLKYVLGYGAKQAIKIKFSKKDK